MVGFGGADQTNGEISSGTIDIASDSNFAFMMPRNATLSSLSFNISTTTGMALLGSTVTLQAKVYRATSGSNTFSPVAGSTVFASPPLTGVVPVGTTAQGTLSALSIPVVAGDRLLLVVSAQASGAPEPIGLRVSGGLGIQ